MNRPGISHRHPREVVQTLQEEHDTAVCCPGKSSRIGFAFSSKDRVPFTVATLSSMDTESGFDVIWVDGSDTPEGKALPRNYKLQNACLVEAHSDVKGGPDHAICFGLARLIELGYDYCGLIENDMVFEAGWFKELVGLFELAASDGVVCGAATVRSYQSRVIEYRHGYFLSWNIGAGMVLFSRAAAQLLLARYQKLRMTSRSLYRFCGEMFGIDLRGLYDLWGGAPDRPLGLDWGYSPILYRHGFASVGSIPSMVRDLEFDVSVFLRTNYVNNDQQNAGLAFPPMSARRLRWMDFSDPFFRWGWYALNRLPHLSRWLLSLHRTRSRRARKADSASLGPPVRPTLPTG